MYKLLSTLNKCWENIIVLLHIKNMEKLKEMSKNNLYLTTTYIYSIINIGRYKWFEFF